MEISEFQKRMYDLYAHNDKRRGSAATTLWLVEEIGELAEAIRREDMENIREELADCFAWIGALANLYDIDLEAAFLEKYPDKCPTCKQNPCICTD
ncbi:MazG nucleotide pyrophosphohydrolase domain-containing protein [uncultured Methanolobus sp.]|uniref:MazG nucleotide pyrophosphohydrolase domain-containing protein n=1 Tax=uncultured Methanolobus sp. TaxID=218300 RepID=UPI002AAC343B|nr:MazG nucleotide pyrophosphohydrolase domain-containing protein [uncultured Methanolobus sp.]